MADLDHRSGLQEGYSAKLMRPNMPQGRAGIHFKDVRDRTPAGDIEVSGASEFITHALGLRLVVVDEAQAEALGAVPAPRRSVACASLHHQQARIGKVRRMTNGQHEAMHGAKVAADLLKVSVQEHPFVSEDPVLKSEADAIAALLGDLYRRIAAAD
ncbi:hypothetical protein [Brevundimonas sp.]|uniref:hypothetical protein n=1 Tax=Brevundimonas sp. TaxID=1871086 RepID=UPI001A203B83|nr:hypothetical protein [Brevundimonas sp.]MBJ7484348.1 hypothetical protein [Brevundimonas sp.]